MAIDQVFQDIILSKRKVRSLGLSYRIYGHLKDSDQKIFNKYKYSYPPLIRSIALHLFKKSNKSFNKAYFKQAEELCPRLINLYRDFIIKNGIYSSQFKADKYIVKELVFQGFVPMEDFKLNSRYGYFRTNRRIEGKFYIYPMKFSDDYSTLRRGKYPYYINYLGLIGIPGLIKYQYSNE